VLKHEGGEFEPEYEHDNRLKAHEIKIAGLERMVGKLTMELEFRPECWHRYVVRIFMHVQHRPIRANALTQICISHWDVMS
jgi:hypothetical protein